MYIYPTNVTEISYIVFHLKSDMSADYDEISSKVVKSDIHYISKPLCEIFNISFYTYEFLDKLKIAKVSPVLKSDDKLLINIYRPISVLPVFCEILERYNRLLSYLNLKFYTNV